MAAVCHLEYEFCYSGPPTKSTMWLDYHVKLWYRSDIPCRRYIRFYNFATLAGKCLTVTTPLFGGFEPLNIVGGHSNPQKAHPWVMTRHLSHKWLNSVQGFDLGGVSRKKSITMTGQDRTTKKSQKRNILHIWGKAPRKDIAMKFGIGVDVLEIVTWAEFDL